MKKGKRKGLFLVEAVLSLSFILFVSFIAFSIIKSYSQNKVFLSKKRKLLACVNSLASKVQEEKCRVSEEELSCGDYLLKATVVKEEDGVPYFRIGVYKEGREVETEKFFCP